MSPKTASQQYIDLEVSEHLEVNGTRGRNRPPNRQMQRMERRASRGGSTVDLQVVRGTEQGKSRYTTAELRPERKPAIEVLERNVAPQGAEHMVLRTPLSIDHPKVT